MKPILIVVAGGSASGKTTVVKEIAKVIGNKALFLKHDDYYKCQDHLTRDERKKTNYDHPDALENELLVQNLIDLLHGKEIDKPIYDFVEQTRKKEYEHIKPKSIIIFEGILALQDPRVRDLADIKVFVKCDDDIRFIRRLKRDTEERGRTVDNIINQYMTTVRPMHHLFVAPTIRYADIIIPNDNNHKVATEILIRNIKALMEENKNDNID